MPMHHFVAMCRWFVNFLLGLYNILVELPIKALSSLPSISLPPLLCNLLAHLSVWIIIQSWQTLLTICSGHVIRLRQCMQLDTCYKIVLWRFFSPTLVLLCSSTFPHRGCQKMLEQQSSTFVMVPVVENQVWKIKKIWFYMLTRGKHTILQRKQETNGTDERWITLITWWPSIHSQDAPTMISHSILSFRGF